MHNRAILEKFFPPLVRKNEIFRTQDEQGSIIVYEHRNFRILTFDSICEQSKIRIDDPFCIEHEYARAMLLPLLQASPARATLLGLGGGSLATCLFHAFPGIQILAVEWRQAVIDVAYQYFDLPQDARLVVKQGDARAWLARLPDRSSDLVLADLYHASEMHDLQLEQVFFENCRRILSEGGWLALNYHELPMADSSAMKQLHRHFPAVFLLRANTGNWVVLACTQPVMLEEMAARAVDYLPASLLSGLRKLLGRLRISPLLL